jgi:hypothetical protein
MEIFRAIGTLAPGNVGGEIMAFARTTLDKAKAGDPVTGGLKLQEFIGKKGVAKLRQWMKVQDAEDLEKFNEDHFIAMFGKDAVFCTEELDGLTISTPAKVRDYFKNQFVIGHKDNGDPVRKPLLEAWLESSDRRTFTKIVNKPTPLSARDGEYNLWQGFAVEPDDTKSCQLFLEHIKDNICSGNEEHYNFTMNLLALTVQEPGIPTRIAMVLRGRQGTGKGIFVNAIGALFGRRYYVHLNSADMLTGSFNNHLSGKIIVFADESFFAGDKSHVGALKRLITEPTLLIQPKFVDATMQDNHVHLFIATNEDRSYPVEPDDRRAFMPCVSPTVRPTAYYKAILEELDNGGREGLLALLQQWPVDRELLEKIPMTAEKRLQARHSMRPAHEWWMTVLYTGVLSTQRNWPTKPLTKAEIHEIFLQWCRTAGRNYPPNIVVFGREMSKFFDRIEKRTSKARMLDFGSLTDARKDWDKQMGETNWDGDSEVFELNPPF